VREPMTREPEPFYVKTTPGIGEVEDYVIEQFERVRGKRPLRVDVVSAPGELGVIVYLDDITEEDWDFMEKLGDRLSVAGEPAVVTGSTVPGLGVRSA